MSETAPPSRPAAVGSPVNRLDRDAVEHAARTAVGAVASLVAARALGLRESYWATVTTMVVLQSTLGAALSVSTMRFVGTALGAVAGASAAAFGSSVLALGGTVFLLGVLIAVLHLDRSALRFAGMTAVIVMLVPRDASPWIVAAHRFVEVSVGIAVALLLTAVWHDREPAPPAPAPSGPRPSIAAAPSE